MTVIIGIDAHRRSHTAVALDERDQVLDELRVEATDRQVRLVLAFARRWPDRIWAMENANGLGWLLSRQLVERGEQVRDVPAALSAQVRKLSGSGHKTDAHDARSTAVAVRHARVLRQVVPDGTPQMLGLLIERRWHIASARQKTLVRIHEQLAKLLPGGVDRHLSADKTARALRRIRATDPVAAMRRRIMTELLAELRVLDRKRKAINSELDRALHEYGTQLLTIDGIGRVGAATIIGIVGDVRRFPSEDHFASFNGTAPIAASSATGSTWVASGRSTRSCTPPRRSRTRWANPARLHAAPHRRGQDQGRSHPIAERQISNAVYRALRADVLAHEVSGEDNRAA
jgi:transposase